MLGFITCSQGFFEHISFGLTELGCVGMVSYLLLKIKDMFLFHLMLVTSPLQSAMDHILGL